MADLLELLFYLIIVNNIGRATACLVAGGLILEHIDYSVGIASDMVRGLSIVVVVCCVIAALSLILHFFAEKSSLLSVIGIIFCFVLGISAFDNLDAVNEYETTTNAHTQQQTSNQIFFGNRSVQCTQCRGSGKCSACNGDGLVSGGDITFKCNVCIESPTNCRMCEGTGRKKY